MLQIFQNYLRGLSRNSIGMDDYLNRFWDAWNTSNYPPYNLIQVNNVESRFEIALGGIQKERSIKSSRSLENYMWKAKKKNQS